MKKGRLTLTVFLMIAATDVIESVGQVLFKEGVNSVGINDIILSNLPAFLMKAVSNPFVWAGFAVYAVNFFLWMTILSRVDLSVALPIGSISYICVPLFSIFFLHENVNPLRWFGIIFIISGVYFVSQSTRNRGDSR